MGKRPGFPDERDTSMTQREYSPGTSVRRVVAFLCAGGMYQNRKNSSLFRRTAYTTYLRADSTSVRSYPMWFSTTFSPQRESGSAVSRAGFRVAGLYQI
jgi:hypothetical protein